MKVQSIGFIGGGRVTQFLLSALKEKYRLPDTIIITEPDETMRNRVKAIDPQKIQCVSEYSDVLNTDILFLAVHPPVLKELGPEISGKIKNQTIVVSLIPVVTIEKLKAMLGVGKIVRMIPNAPSLIHQGYNPVTYSGEISTKEKQLLNGIFRHWGEAPEVDEQKLEAFAIVTAMGPTYFWPQWIKLQSLGKEFGLSEEELNQGISSMLQGSISLLYQSDLSAEKVMDLIPVYPLKEKEPEITGFFENSLRPLYKKLKGISG